MTAVANAGSLGWEDLPPAVRSEIGSALGAGVVRALRQDADAPGAVTVRLRLDDERWVFVRALPATHPLARRYASEARIGALLPANAPVPRLLCHLSQDWVTLVCTDLDGARPNLRPGSPDCTATLTALGTAARTLTPCPVPSAPEAATALAPLTGCWARLAAAPPRDLDPWLAQHLDALAALDTAWCPWADGDTLLHTDPRPEAMVRTGPGRVLITGWQAPARGAAWLDFVAIIPHLLAAGQTVTTAERLVLRRPELRGVPAWAITGYAVARAGYAQLAARRAVPPVAAMLGAERPDGGAGAALGLQAVGSAAAAEAVATVRWIRHRTRW